jgi:8-oxo-dGTP diphosphatase
MTKYVMGLLFSKDCSKIALIRKQKPEWQLGLLNGVGGKVEDGETYLQAMTREAKEEANIKADWKEICTLRDLNEENFVVACFYAVDCILDVTTVESEIVGIYEVNDIITRKEKTIPNIPWLVNLALDHIYNPGHPIALEAIYE